MELLSYNYKSRSYFGLYGVIFAKNSSKEPTKNNLQIDVVVVGTILLLEVFFKMSLNDSLAAFGPEMKSCTL